MNFSLRQERVQQCTVAQITDDLRTTSRERKCACCPLERISERILPTVGLTVPQI